MCEHEEESDAMLGWICGVCRTSLSPYLDICPVCTNIEKEECLHRDEVAQDEILNNDRLFENLRGN